MGKISSKATSALKTTRIPFWGFLFHVTVLDGRARFGGANIRVLYAGTKPFLHYFKELVFCEPPKEERVGSYKIYEMPRVCEELGCDIEIFRSHQSLANMGLFPSAYFIPEWIAGTANLKKQLDCESTSKSRRRDRALLTRNDISYSVTRKLSDLDDFYDKMYLPHIEQKHGGSVFLMTREQMHSRVKNDDARLVMVHRRNEPVGGSLIIQEKGLPRLYSQGVLNNDKDLMRLGVGTAIYLYSFDYLINAGYSRVNMGWSRTFLTDGSLYFKQRFGLKIGETSPIGHYLKHTSGSKAANEFMAQTGFMQHRRGSSSAVLFGACDSERDQHLVARKTRQCESMGVDRVVAVDLKQAKPSSEYSGFQEKAG